MSHGPLQQIWVLTEEELPPTPDKDNKIRLQKYLAGCGVASRRRAEALIERGRVQVNNEIVTELGTKITPGVDEVRVKGKLVLLEEKGIILLHKPKHVVSTMDDPEGRPTVADYLSARYRSYYPVGRLDWESAGLVIMTNDGELAQRLLHPKFEIDRTYEVLVRGSVPYEVADKLSRGIELEDGVVKGDARVFAQEEVDGEQGTWLEVTIAVGRNRIVRRTFEKLGFPVVKLHRTKHGPFKLGNIKVGEIRRLTEREYHDAVRRVLGERQRGRR